MKKPKPEQLQFYLPHSFTRLHIPRWFKRLHGRKARRAWAEQCWLWSRRSLPFALGMSADVWLQDLNRQIRNELYGRGTNRVPLRSAVITEITPMLQTARQWKVAMEVYKWTLGNYDKEMPPLARIANAQFFKALGLPEGPASYICLRDLLNKLVKLGVLGRIRSRGKVASIFWLKPVQERLLEERDPQLRSVGEDNGAALYDNLDALAADAEAAYRHPAQPIYTGRLGVAKAASTRR